MKFSNAEVAQVLEDAADLYESEKVEWCKNTWGSLDVIVASGQVGMTACAATSLGMAAGLGLHVAGVIDGMPMKNIDHDEDLTAYFNNLLEERLSLDWVQRMVSSYGYDAVVGFTPQAVRLYDKARREVEKRILKFGSSTLPNFNDGANGTKQAIIDLFKETAKDLRNA